MRVLHVIPSISPRRGGPSAALIPMLASLTQRGIDCAVLTSNDDGPDNSNLATGEWLDYQGIKLLAFPRKRLGMRWFDEHIVSPAALDWLGGQGHQWDLLHVHAVFSYLSTRTMSWARRQGRPYLCRPLGQLCEWSLAHKPLRKSCYLALVEKANLEAAARVHFTSELERQECEAAGITVRPMVVPHGVAMPELADPGQPKQPNQGLSVVFVGRLDPKKGLERLIDGFSQVCSAIDARLTIAGTGDQTYQRGLADQAAAHSESIHFSGWVEGEQKRHTLMQADIFVLPSFSENFGVAVLEAMSFGIPVLVTAQVALAGPISGAGAGLIIDGSAQSIAAALTELAADPERRRRMGEAGRALAASQFSWPAVAAQLDQQYRDILALA